MSEKPELSQEDILEDLFKSVPKDVEVVADFPSRGQFYKPLDASKEITITPLTFAIEKKLVNYEGEEVLDCMIKNCLHNMDYRQLLPMDKLYVLIKIRELSWGADFSSTVTCPFCGVQDPIKILISELPIKYLPEDYPNPIERELPVSKLTIKVRLVDQGSLDYMDTLEKSDINAWRFVESISNSERTVKDKKTIQKAIQRLPLPDRHTMLKLISPPDYGIETNFLYECEKCEKTIEMEVPFSKDFFTMS